MDETLTLEFDGGARGNPGPAGIGVVIRAADGTPLVTIGKPIGHATNNVAEYKALILALEKARQLGAKKIHIRGDSELIVKQMRGEYKVKNADLRDLWEQAQHLYHQFNEARIDHNLRDKNKLADRLVNRALDLKREVTDADDSPIDDPSPAESKPGDGFACPRCGCSITVRTPSRLRPHQLRPFICQCGARMNPAGGA
jgi:ribonuclease HI